MSKSLRTYFINNIDKGVFTASELFYSLSSKYPNLTITKLTFISEKPYKQNNNTSNNSKPLSGFNDTTSHPFLTDFLFKEAIPLTSNSSEKIINQENNEEISFFEKAIDLIVTLESIEDKSKIYSYNEKLKSLKSDFSGALKKDQGKEKIEVELWIENLDASNIENLRILLHKNQVGYIKEKKMELNEINSKKKDLKIISLEKKFQNSSLSVIQFDIGILKEPNYFISYFSSEKLKRAIFDLSNSRPDIEFYFHAKDDSNSQKLFLIIKIIDKIEWKLEFSYKFCHSFRFEPIKDSDEVWIYISLILPPRFYLNETEYYQYENPFLRHSWTRTHNFIVFGKKYDELMRLFLMNNSTIRIRVKNKECLLSLQKKAERANILKKDNVRRIEEKNIKITDDKCVNEKFLKSYKFGDEITDFNIKYNILCLVSENRVSIFDKEMRKTLKEIATEKKYKFEIVERTLEDYFKLKKREFFGDFYKQDEEDEDFKDFFDSIYKRSERELRLKSKDPDMMLLETRKITITPTGVIYSLKEKEMSNRILRKYSEFLSYFLRVKFSDDNLQDTKSMKFIIDKHFRTQSAPLKLLGREYRLLAFSASQLRASSCWLFANNSQLTIDKIIEETGDFKDKLPAKRAARIGQSFAASAPVVLKHILTNADIVKEINDIYPQKGTEYEKLCFSDGIGKISLKLMKKIKKERNFNCMPSALQIRMGGAKGVLAMDPTLEGDQVQLRPSMVKFESKNDILEILDYSKFRGGYLNRQIILLLITLGVPEQIFDELQTEYLQDLKNCELKDASIFKYFNAEYNGEMVSLPPITALIRKLINAQFNLQNEPFFLGIQRTLRQRGLYNLKNKCNILVKKGARLLGVLDEYGVLEPNEVFIQVLGLDSDKKEDLDKEIELIQEKVIVTRNPCLHPGDIRVMNAVYHEKLKHFVNCVVFPQKGPRPVTSEISGGDLDGDLYFVSWDQRLIPKKIQSALSYIPEPKNYKEKENITYFDMMNFFFDYMNFDILGTVANSHLAIADQSEKLANDHNCIELSKIHSDAVDFVKTGYCPPLDGELKAKKWPDYMREKKHLIVYESQTILGKLFRKIRDIIAGEKANSVKEIWENNYEIDLQLLYGDWKKYLKEAMKIIRDYQFDLEAIMNQFGVRNEFEVYSGNFSKLSKEERKGKANVEILQRRILDAIINLKRTYITKFNDIPDSNNDEEDYSKISALYVCSYVNRSHRKDSGNLNTYDIFNELFESKVFNYIEDHFENIEKNRFIGLPWLIGGDLLIQIKKKNILKNNIKDDNKEEKLVNADAGFEENSDKEEFLEEDP